MSQGLTTTGDPPAKPKTFEECQAFLEEYKKSLKPKIKTEFRTYFNIDQGAPEDSWITALLGRTEFHVITKVATLLGIEKFDEEYPQFQVNGTFANIQQDVLCVVTRIHMLPSFAQTLENTISEQKFSLDWSPLDDETYLSQEVLVDFFTNDHNVVIQDANQLDSADMLTGLLECCNLQPISIHRLQRKNYGVLGSSLQCDQWQATIRTTERNFLTQDLKEKLTTLGLRITYRRQPKRQRQVVSVQYPAKPKTYATALTKGSSSPMRKTNMATHIDALHNSKCVTDQSPEKEDIHTGTFENEIPKDQSNTTLQTVDKMVITSSQLNEAIKDIIQPQKGVQDEEGKSKMLDKQPQNKQQLTQPDLQEAQRQTTEESDEMQNNNNIHSMDRRTEENRSGPSSPEKRKRQENQ